MSNTAASPYEIYLAPRTWGAHEPWLTIPVDIKLVKDDLDRYSVTLRSTGQALGMVWRSRRPERRGASVAGILNSAYYPADADLMTRTVQHDNHHAESWATIETAPVGSRAEGVNHILYELGRRAAASVEPMIEEARRPFITAQAAAGEIWAIRHLQERP